VPRVDTTRAKGFHADWGGGDCHAKHDKRDGNGIAADATSSEYVDAVDLFSTIDLASDPLEEYALGEPETCAGYRAWKPVEARWNYCRLTEVVKEQSFLQ
jgi:hypothetical protein